MREVPVPPQSRRSHANRQRRRCRTQGGGHEGPHTRWQSAFQAPAQRDGRGPQRPQPRRSTFPGAPHLPRAPSSTQGPGRRPVRASSNRDSHDCCHLSDYCHVVLRQASVSVDSLWKDYNAASCPRCLSRKPLPGRDPRPRQPAFRALRLRGSVSGPEGGPLVCSWASQPSGHALLNHPPPTHTLSHLLPTCLRWFFKTQIMSHKHTGLRQKKKKKKSHY